MDPYEKLLVAMQEMVTGAYHADRLDNDRLHRVDYACSIAEVNDKLSDYLRPLFEEVRDRLHYLAERERLDTECMASDQLRSLTFSMAAAEIDAYLEGHFTYEPIETRVPEELPTTISTAETAHAILEALAGESPTITPHFMYDATSGATVGIYPRKGLIPLEKTKETETTQTPTFGHTKWVFSATRRENVARRVAFGKDIQDRREILGLSRKNLARWVEINPRTLRELEDGVCSRVGGTDLRQGHWLIQRLAEYLNTTTEDIWPWDDDKEKDTAW